MKIKDGFKLRDVMGQPTVVGEGIEQVDFTYLITLNPSAAYLWRQVEGREFTVDQLAQLLVDHYAIHPDTAHTDAIDLVNEWINHKLLRP